MKIITFFFKIIVGDFMIDDTNYADCLALYNFNHVDKIKGKEYFSYIFNDNINYIHSLYNRGKIRNVTYDTIQKTILCGSIYLGYNLLSALIAATNLSFLTNVTPSSVLLVALKRLNYVLFIFPLSLSMPSTVISSLPFQNI